MCNYTGLIKRVIPFALTFAVGLLIASIFVPVGFPGANWRSERRVHKMRQLQQLRMENDELREKNRVLRIENDELRRTATIDFGTDFEATIPPPPPPIDLHEHHPPQPPKRDPKQVYGTQR